MKTLRILGIRGLPAAHGGFETFAEHLSLHLVQAGWRVVVYCQEDGAGPVYEDVWQGVERVHIPVERDGPAGTIVFDWLATRHAAQHQDLCLTLGYNTAVFCALLRWKGISNVINMDGIEWRRAKWGALAKSWFWMNDWAGCWLGNHLVADNPEIAHHLSSRVRASKITTIAYGADDLANLPTGALGALGLEPGRYLTVVARAEPENSLLEVVQGFSAQHRGLTLAVLGRYEPDNAYHRAVKAAAGPEVRFLGAIYDKQVVQALRYHGVAYVHGHQVGGTNPSLVEALGAGNPVFAHDNQFNRWVAGPEARYFTGASDFSALLAEVLSDPAALQLMGRASRARFRDGLTWPQVLGEYEALLSRFASPMGSG
ncbi:MAG: DUF1972 domain-containing protein [Rubrivivax sp.]|nr:DUF1972 domain-containing protein [Rubrivivax sp.]